jgi:hypothetical protein
MKDNFTAIAYVMDASSSMSGLAKETISSFNQFIKEQKDVPGEAAFSLCVFNTEYRLVHDFIPLQNVEELNTVSYRCSGCTALLDAMGTTIDALGTKLAAMPEEDRPSKVIVLVVTDGEENSSRKFTLDQIKAKVTLQQEKYNWQFVFMGANIDAISAGTSMGFTAHNSMQYSATDVGTHSLYRSVSAGMTSYRSSVGPRADFFDQVIDQPADPNAATPAVKSGTFDPGNPLPIVKK